MEPRPNKYFTWHDFICQICDFYVITRQSWLELYDIFGLSTFCRRYSKTIDAAHVLVTMVRLVTDTHTRHTHRHTLSHLIISLGYELIQSVIFHLSTIKLQWLLLYATLVERHSPPREVWHDINKYMENKASPVITVMNSSKQHTAVGNTYRMYIV